MPDIFSEDNEITVIEYGENCSSFPLWDKLKQKISAFFEKQA